MFFFVDVFSFRVENVEKIRGKNHNVFYIARAELSSVVVPVAVPMVTVVAVSMVAVVAMSVVVASTLLVADLPVAVKVHPNLLLKVHDTVLEDLVLQRHCVFLCWG